MYACMMRRRWVKATPLYIFLTILNHFHIIHYALPLFFSSLKSEITSGIDWRKIRADFPILELKIDGKPLKQLPAPKSEFIKIKELIG